MLNHSAETIHAITGCLRVHTYAIINLQDAIYQLSEAFRVKCMYLPVASHVLVVEPAVSHIYGPYDVGNICVGMPQKMHLFLLVDLS